MAVRLSPCGRGRIASQDAIRVRGRFHRRIFPILRLPYGRIDPLIRRFAPPSPTRGEGKTAAPINPRKTGARLRRWSNRLHSRHQAAPLRNGGKPARKAPSPWPSHWSCGTADIARNRRCWLQELRLSQPLLSSRCKTALLQTSFAQKFSATLKFYRRNCGNQGRFLVQYRLPETLFHGRADGAAYNHFFHLKRK
jgi:hypothetical protein